MVNVTFTDSKSVDSEPISYERNSWNITTGTGLVDVEDFGPRGLGCFRVEEMCCPLRFRLVVGSKRCGAR